MNRLKQESTKNLWLYGGSSLITTFIELNLIDEYRLSIHPVILGSGKPLFDDLKHRLNLTLIETNTFTSGVVQLIYRTH
ncbi:dihydrofolate reductase [Staphylococcus gallinarum]|uniref:Dihydrofolate reductase n=1 Tax=Staphylococcus gallinarum TaxID=1293 RepID=A0A380FIU2_STAGA|nr:dihydrofolate reductase [Staphylococcus gallinarum]